ncbi:MAG: TrbC/VirB2 family protein [Bacteriovoracales bacterium]|nr:TrbC/VirB2 family protein [Bacteriovoracales bacterium]
MMVNFLKTLFLVFLIFPQTALGKSLDAMAKSATHELRSIGVSVIALGLVWAGYLYVRGGGEGKRKLEEVAVGAVLILGAAAVLAFLRKVVGT